MGRYQLWTLRRRDDGAGQTETRNTWIESNTTDQAIAQAMVIAEATFADWSGIAMLTNEAGSLIWSVRKGMPRLDDPGG